MALLKKFGRFAWKEASSQLVKAIEFVEDKLSEEPEVAGAQQAGGSSGQSSTSPDSLAERFSLGDVRQPAQLFGARSCPWSGRCRRLLEGAGIDFRFVDLDLPGSGPIREELVASTGKRTIPWVFLRGQFVGGFEGLDEVQRLGLLEEYTLDPKERGDRPGPRIEVMQKTELPAGDQARKRLKVLS
ncbi:MAG: glutaredoxin [Polyangiaceae bacterium]|nr:glutaredoxin [Polyangiaceae bacterium]